MEITVDQALKQAVEAHQAGRLNEAEKLYRAILQVQPQHPDASHNLGLIAVLTGHVDASLPLFKAALDAAPDVPQYRISFFDALLNSGRVGEAGCLIQNAAAHGEEKLPITTMKERLSSAIPECSPAALIRAFNAGRYLEAELIAQQLTAAQPENPFGWKALGAILRQAGRTQDALLPMQKSVELNPNDAEALCNLGTLLVDLGLAEEAAGHCRHAIAIKPDHATAYNTLGAALKEMGMREEAEAGYRKAIALDPDYAEPYNNLGNLLRIQNRMDEAMWLLNKAIELKPDYADAYNNLGVLLTDMGQPEQAENAFRKVISIKPGYLEAIGSLGVALYEMGKFEEAEACYRSVISINPNSAVAFCNLGNALSELGKDAEAESAYLRAVSIEPRYADAHFNLGIFKCEHGKIKEGIASLELALSLNPQHAEFHRAISRYKKFSANDPEIAIMRGIYEDPGQPRKARERICFALAKAYEDVGNHDESFRLYAEGNSLGKAERGYDIARDKALFDAIRKAFTNINLDKHGELSSNPTRQYIAIVGMPRSGTTLVDQILSSHSSVFGAGELDAMNDILFETFRGADERVDFALSEAKIEQIRIGYQASLNKRDATKPVIVDKMPHNFRWLGFMLLAMPEIRVVHTMRDPIATCWSIFKNYFPARGLGFTWDLNDIGQYYTLYRDLMAFWHEKFPGRIYDLDYEKLTEHQEEETRKLLDYCGLPWEDACLNFHETERAVRTASAAQVRRKIYKGSSKDWKQFEKHLGPLKRGLGLE